MNIVHCDVCPHNILITSEGLPKLTDFGIARAKTMTETENVSGKLPFMSPEQARGENLDFRSDIYSLGAVLFYMLCGNSMRELKTDMSLILKQAQDNKISWEKLPKDLPEELHVILKKMLATELDSRYQQTTDLARDLEYYIYKSGYGPTIVTLSEYMHKFMPGKFKMVVGHSKEDLDKTVKVREGVTHSDKTIKLEKTVTHSDKTIIMPIDKTVILPENYFHQKTERDS
jgi:serine/threonine protein kinase